MTHDKLVSIIKEIKMKLLLSKGFEKERKNKMKRYGIYRINFTVDTGYVFKNRVCIIMATDSEEAMKDFRSWFNKVAPTESIIVDTLTDITFCNVCFHDR